MCTQTAVKRENIDGNDQNVVADDSGAAANHLVTMVEDSIGDR